MKIVAISDVHCRWDKVTVPECDLLVSCGDYSFKGEFHVVRDFHKWLNKQPAKHIISGQGNHERHVEADFEGAKKVALEACPRVHFVEEGRVEIEGVKIWVTPMTPFFCNWSYNRVDEEVDEEMIVDFYTGKTKLVKSIKPHFDAIPDDTQVLVSHGPVYDILDKTCFADGTRKSEPLGSRMLLKRVKELKELDLFFSGHIHFQGGSHHHEGGVSFYNASICDEMYVPSNPITIVEYDPTEKKPKPKKERRSVKNEYFKLKHAITDAIIAQEERLEESKKTLSTTTYMTPVQAVDSTIAELEKLRSYIRNVMLYKK